MQVRRPDERVFELEQLCKERGVPFTPQRRVVFEALLESADHPTAERLYDRVCCKVPGISTATVYRVLEFLVEFGVARKTCSPGRQCRYDAKVHRHHHLICLYCDRMVDLEDTSLNHLPIPDRIDTGFELVDYSIQFRGTCPDCLHQRETQLQEQNGSSPDD